MENKNNKLTLTVNATEIDEVKDIIKLLREVEH